MILLNLDIYHYWCGTAALELLRNERSITGCYAESQFYRDPDKAERTFQSTSVNARSQFNYETGKDAQRSHTNQSNQNQIIEAMAHCVLFHFRYQ